jgi:TIR domain
MDQAADFSSATPAPTGSGQSRLPGSSRLGYRIVAQAWDFGPSRDWAREMQQATATAERVVAVLSATYLQSGHR